MISLEVAVSFFAASVLIALSPGPDILFVLTQSLSGGARRGLVLAAGLCSGLVVQTALVASGVAALFAASPVAFAILKIVGACYLLWLAWGAFRAPEQAVGVANGQNNLRGWKLFRRGIIMNLTNPKIGIFMLAFLPPFADPARGNMGLQLAELGVLCMVASFFVFSVVAFVAGSVGQKFLQSPRAQWVLTRASGVVFVGLAVWLLLSAR